MTTYNALTKRIESLKADLASINDTIGKIENQYNRPSKGRLEDIIICYREEKLNSACRLKSEIEQHIQKLETERRTMMLKAQKEVLLECIAEAENAEDLATYTDMLNKFNTLHPEI